MPLPQGNIKFLTLERAHRVSERHPPKAPVRPVVAHLLCFQDCDHILKKVRNTGEYKTENNVVLIFLDYTMAVQYKRASFVESYKWQREEGLKYMLPS